MLSASEIAVGVGVADVSSWSVSLLQMDPNDFEYIVQLRVRATSHLSPQSLSLFCYHKEYLVALRQHFIGYWQSRFALSRHASPHGCLLWASSCNAEERSNLLGITVAPPAVNTLLPTVTLAPVTNFNESLVSRSI